MGLLCDYNSASSSVKLKQNINANNKVEINPNFQISKTYKESWFEFVDLRSEKAKELFSSKGYDIKIGEEYNLLDLLEKERASNFENLEELAPKFGVTKQGYYQWRRTGNVPHRHVKKVAEYLNMTPKEAVELNFRKTYGSHKR